MVQETYKNTLKNIAKFYETIFIQMGTKTPKSFENRAVRRLAFVRVGYCVWLRVRVCLCVHTTACPCIADGVRRT